MPITDQPYNQEKRLRGISRVGEPSEVRRGLLNEQGNRRATGVETMGGMVSKGWMLGLVTILAAGCASGPTHEEELATRDQEIQALGMQLNQAKHDLVRENHEREVVENDLGSKTREIDSLKETVGAQQRVIEEKEQKADLYGRLASTYQERTEQAESEMQRLRQATVPTIEVPALIIEEEPAMPDGNVHLRIISLPKNSPNRDAIDEITYFLEKLEIEHVVPRASGNFWVIDIGYFSNTRVTEAVSLRDRMRSMKFQGVRQFEDSIFVTY